MQSRIPRTELWLFQYRKRYGLHAIFSFLPQQWSQSRFQYRKRYGLHAIINKMKNLPRRSFNTASGMDCMQFDWDIVFLYQLFVSIPQAVWIACNKCPTHHKGFLLSFNTASGMDCMQCRNFVSFVRTVEVSIPQAVWIACNVSASEAKDFAEKRFNTASGMDCMQYCLPEALETVSPKTEFLTMTPFSRFFPK